MKNNLFDEIQKMKRMSFYDVKKTLNENHTKPLLLEQGGSAFSIISKALKNVFKSTTEGTGFLARDYIEVGGKKLLVRGNQLYDESNALVDDVVLPGGKTMKAADVIKLANGNFTNLSDETLDMLFDTVEAAAKSDSAVREALETSAEESMGSLGHTTEYIDGAKKKIQQLVDEGKTGEEAIEEVFNAWRRQAEIDHPNLNEEDFNFIKNFFFKGTKLRPKAPIEKLGYGKRFINWLGWKKFVSNITRATSQLKGTEESFFEELEGTIRRWSKEIDDAGDDPFKLESTYKKIASEMEPLINENTFKKTWFERWELSQLNSVKTIEDQITKTLKEENWTDEQIATFIEKVKSKDVSEMLDNITKSAKESGYGANDEITNLKNNILKNLGYSKDKIEFMEKMIYKRNLGLAKLWNRLVSATETILNLLRGLFVEKFDNTLSALNYGVFRSPGQILTNLTRYGKGGKNLAAGFLITYAELMAIKIFISPIITGGLYVLLYLIEMLTELVDRFIPGTFGNWLKEKRSVGNIILDGYLKWIPEWAEKTLDNLYNTGEFKANDKTYTEIKNAIPIQFNSDAVNAEKNLLIALGGVASGIFGFEGRDPEETSGQYSTKAKNKLDTIEQNLTNKADSIVFQMIATPESKMNYADKFDGRYYALKGFLDDKNLRKKLMRNNNLTESDCDRINKNLDIAFCPEVKSTKDVNLSNADEEDKGAICSGIWTKDRSKVYKIGGVGNIYKFIDDDGTEKPIKDVLSKDLTENYKIKMFDMKNLIRKIILEEEEEKTLKMKDWDEIFSFQKVDEKESGKYTDVKIKMDSVMDRMPHWRKKYKKQCEDIDNCDDDGEDDSFVRAVIDTHPEVVRVLFTKGMAHLTSSDDQED
jgi:ElaB/YqjD/DUF883 family membrane-anchored ribosome-binding protein